MAEANPVLFDDGRIAIGAAVIAGDNPAGSDVRGTPEFEAIETEIRRMDADGPNAVDWRLVADRSLALLRDQSKDLLVAAWLGYALVRLEGFKGLAVGLKVIEGMIATHWEGLFPPARRERARVAPLDWLVARAVPVVQALPAGEANPAAAIAAYDALGEIERLAGEKLQKETVSLVDLYRLLRPIAEEAKRAIAEAERKAEEAARRAEAAQAAAAQAPAVPQGEPAPTAGAVAPSQGLAIDPGDITGTIERLANGLNELARLIRAADRTDPRGYLLNRIASYLRFAQVVDSEAGETMFVSPEETIAEIEGLRAGGQNAEALDHTEEAIWSSPLWLDANRHAVDALTALGPAYASAAAAVVAGFGLIAHRLPAMLGLRFAGGRPFAEAQTRGLVAGGAAGGNGAANAGDRVDQAYDKARSLALAGKQDEAIGLLVAVARQASSERERARAQLAQARLCLETGMAALALPLVDHLDRQVGSEIERWEPDFAADVAELRLRLLRHGDTQGLMADDRRVRALDETMGRLARLDLGRLARSSLS